MFGHDATEGSNEVWILDSYGDGKDTVSFILEDRTVVKVQAMIETASVIIYYMYHDEMRYVCSDYIP